MFNGEMFSLNVPSLNAAATNVEEIQIADGCSNNSNYYTDNYSRGTCCCSCDKAAATF